MKKIYNFDMYTPPSLTEELLRRKAEKRRLRRQTALLAFSGILLEAGLWAAALLLYPAAPVLSAVSLLYSCISVTGAAVILLVLLYKRREIT